MALGCPSIAANCNFGPSSLIQNNQNGLLFPVDDTQVLTEHLLRLMGNPDERKRIGSAAARIVDQYSVSAIADQWEVLFAGAERTRTRTTKSAKPIEVADDLDSNSANWYLPFCRNRHKMESKNHGQLGSTQMLDASRAIVPRWRRRNGNDSSC